MIPESGLLLIDKPYGWTSFDVVNKTRRIVQTLAGKKLKTGHTGTLDPLATGLLVLCYGSATKKIEELTGLGKEYLATLEFGATTASFDKEQPIDNRYEFMHIDEESIRNSMPGFTGNIMQVPPAHSAKWVNGRRAYEYARKGKEAPMEERETVVHELELLNISLPFASFRINCGKGFYVRSFARDMGLALNSGAYLSELRRTRIGPFSIDNAISIDQVESYLLKNTL
jgi:tRNA pseudouridine55 synthase